MPKSKSRLLSNYCHLYQLQKYWFINGYQVYKNNIFYLSYSKIKQKSEQKEVREDFVKVSQASTFWNVPVIPVKLLVQGVVSFEMNF